MCVCVSELTAILLNRLSKYEDHIEKGRCWVARTRVDTALTLHKLIVLLSTNYLVLNGQASAVLEGNITNYHDLTIALFLILLHKMVHCFAVCFQII